MRVFKYKKRPAIKTGLFFGWSLFALPLPVCDFWQIEAFVVDELFVLNEFVAHLLVEVCAAVTEVW